MKWIYTVMLSATYCSGMKEKQMLQIQRNIKWRDSRTVNIEREKENGLGVYKQINTSITQGLL